MTNFCIFRALIPPLSILISNKMAKEKEKKTAHILFVEQGKSRKEIAHLVGVAEKTVGEWVIKFGWEKERSARTASPARRMDNIKEIITTLSDERLELNRKVKAAENNNDLSLIADLRGQISKIDDAVSKWNKALTTIESENRITLSIYINVMEKIFEKMRIHDPKLFMQTIEFQEQHLQQITLELG
jgi:predicted transcriptional regulator